VVGTSLAGSAVFDAFLWQAGSGMQDLNKLIAAYSGWILASAYTINDFFIAHLDVCKAAERPKVLGLWRDFVLRLSSTPVVSIAKIRGRTRGIGNEFVLACNMRFTSRQSALLQPRDRRRTGPGRRGRWNGSHVGTAARGHLKSCSAATISTLISPSAKAGSTARWTIATSTRLSVPSSVAWLRSTVIR
jgi:hypothetical protein